MGPHAMILVFWMLSFKPAFSLYSFSLIKRLFSSFSLFAIRVVSFCRDITLPTKVHLVKGMVFPVVLYGCELDCKENWAPKNWCFWFVVLEKTLDSPLDCREIQSVHPKGNQSWIFIGRTDVEAEIPILWPPDAKSWLIWKDPNVGKDWRREEKGTTMDEMIEWHHQRDGHEFE